MKVLQRISLLAVMLLMAVTAQAQQEKKPSKPVLYIFTAQWCAPCQRMHDEALEDKEVLALLKYMEWHEVDMEFTKDAKELYHKHARSGGVPELIIYNGEGKVIAREVGYTTKSDFLTFLRKAFSAEELKRIEVEYKRSTIQHRGNN